MLKINPRDGTRWIGCAMHWYLTLGHVSYTAQHMAGLLQQLRRVRQGVSDEQYVVPLGGSHALTLRA
jgi:hypothetical protein